jgi:hypothetical protein
MQFNIPRNIRKFDDKNVVILQQIFDYIQTRLQNFPQYVTYTTNMNTDIAGSQRDIVYCTNDNKLYVCTTGGTVGSTVWSALN